MNELGRYPAGSLSTIRNGSPAVCQSSVSIQYEAFSAVLSMAEKLMLKANGCWYDTKCQKAGCSKAGLRRECTSHKQDTLFITTTLTKTTCILPECSVGGSIGQPPIAIGHYEKCQRMIRNWVFVVTMSVPVG